MSAPAPSPWLRDSPGAVLAIFREAGRPLTKAEVVALSGVSRSAITNRIDLLLSAHLLRLAPEGATTGGRPAERYEIDRDDGVLLIADMGASAVRLAMCDLLGAIHTETTAPLDITDGPHVILALVKAGFDDLLREAGLPPSRVRGIGIDVPGPVDHESGRVVHPPIMTGWHDFDVPAWFASAFDCPVLVDKDVNAMALGEQRMNFRDTDDVVFVKLGTGIGTGLVLRGEIYRGADGAAGDLGHIPLPGSADDDTPPLCRCGNLGCIEAYASGWALQRDLAALGHTVDRIEDVVALVGRRDADALRLFRDAARIIGTALSDLVNLVNPRLIVIGGQLAGAEDLLLPTIRELIYRRSLPLATRRLEVAPTGLGERAGVYGLAHLVADEVFSVEHVNRAVRG